MLQLYLNHLYRMLLTNANFDALIQMVILNEPVSIIPFTGKSGITGNDKLCAKF